jgi:3-carboxy-cis,cis-muconate cycloisomerase
VLAEDAAVTRHLDVAQLRTLLDPAHYAGEAQAFVDAVLVRYAAVAASNE